MSTTWTWMIAIAAWSFLIGTVMVAASAVPAAVRRYPRLLITGVALALTSLVLVLAAWGLPRLIGAVGPS